MRIAAATNSVVVTTIGPTQFGRMCRTMMRMSLAPAAFAASTNSFSRSERNKPRTTRASVDPEEEREDDPDLHRLRDGDGDRSEADLGVVRAEVDGSSEKDSNARQRQDEIGEAHQQVVDLAAVVPGDGADRSSDQRREDRDEEGDPQRRADPVDDPAQVVATELVGAEDVPALEPRRQRQPGHGIGVLEVDLVVAVGRDLLREDRDQGEEEQDHEADDREAVPKEAHPRVRPLAPRLELDAGLVCELLVSRGQRGRPDDSRSGLHGRLHHPVTRVRISHTGRADRGSRRRCRRGG